jgi:photosystem II stability/assembly factor-like uncharacterized protein
LGVKSRGNNIWVVGAQGLILHSTDRGDAWNIRESGVSTNLNGLSFPDDLHGWAVGDYGYVVRTTDGGFNWQIQTQLNTPWGWGVFFLDSLSGWICGPIDTVYKTNDGGNSWVKLPQGQPNHGTSVVFVDSLRGWLSLDTGAAGILKTTDGGQTWRFILGSGGQFQSLDMLDGQRGWGAGGDISKTTDGWETWTVQYSPPGYFYGISLGDSSYIWSVGSNSNIDRAMIVSTTNGGSSWTMDTSRVRDNYYYSVDGHLQLTNVTVVGNGGAIVRSTNAGNTWRVIRNVDTKQWGLLNATFYDANLGWATGLNGVITHTTNGGTLWRRQASGTFNYLFGVDFPEALRGWTCSDGGQILTTTDAGNVWTFQTSNTTYPLFSMDFIDTMFGVAVGGYYGPPEPPIGEGHGSRGAWERGETALQNAKWKTNGEIASSSRFIGAPRNDTLPIWGADPITKALGEGRYDFWKYPWRPDEVINQTPYRAITRTTNGGAIWIAQNSMGLVPLYGVSFVTPGEGWACGDPQGGMGVILHTTDSGATWQGQNSNVNRGLYWIQFRNSQTGWSVGDAGTALWTTDGGATWNQGNSGTTQQLLSCAFYDTQNGFACGANGLLLKTADGGRNWQPDTSQVKVGLSAVFALDSTHAWAMGGDAMVLGWRFAGVSGVEAEGQRGRGAEGKGIVLEQSYPNPMIENCAIGYWLTTEGKAELSIYDVTGRRVRFFAPLRMTAYGRQMVRWDGRDETGKNVPTGVYFYQLRVKELTETKKLVKVQ